MDIKAKMNSRFRDLQGGLFLNVAKADVGESVGNFLRRGGENMAWADPFAPDPAIPESVKKVMHEAIDSGLPAHYVMPIGQFELRETVAELLTEQLGRPVDPSRNVIITPGSDSGLLYAMMPFLAEGDEVLIPAPSYPSNFLNSKLLGGVAVPVPLSDADNYRLHIEDFESRLTDRTKMVLITHPNNPTANVFRRDEIEALCRFVVENDLILVSDQAFQDHVFDGIEFVHPCTLPGMWERTLTVCSISKGYGLSGFRIAYICADDHVMDVLYGAAVNVLGAACTLSSLGAITALRDRDYLRDMHARLLRRRDLAYEVFSQIPGVSLHRSESGILSWLNISRLGTSAEICAWLKEHANLMVNSGAPYGEGGEGHIRVVSGCFAHDEDARLRFERIREALTELARQKGLA
ncbi:MAG: pyridoxal phosphate-dependent aminotransferase [Clostridiales bacterium]|nr:pyridoxal phosphate-dependent aminotransferase [Clostridiales bacterium]